MRDRLRADFGAPFRHGPGRERLLALRPRRAAAVDDDCAGGPGWSPHPASLPHRPGPQGVEPAAHRARAPAGAAALPAAAAARGNGRLVGSHRPRDRDADPRAGPHRLRLRAPARVALVGVAPHPAGDGITLRLDHLRRNDRPDAVRRRCGGAGRDLARASRLAVVAPTVYCRSHRIATGPANTTQQNPAIRTTTK